MPVRRQIGVKNVIIVGKYEITGFEEDENPKWIGSGRHSRKLKFILLLDWSWYWRSIFSPELNNQISVINNLEALSLPPKKKVKKENS